MAASSHDLCVCFDKSLIWFDGSETDNLVFSELPVANNVDHSGLGICSPRHTGFARLKIDLVDEFPAIDQSHWDFVAECLIHTFENLRPSTIGPGDHNIFDTATRQPVEAEIPTEMGIYHVCVLIANYHSTVQRLVDASSQGTCPDKSACQFLMYGRNAGETEFEMPSLEALMQLDNYHLLVAPIEDVSVIKPL